MAATNGTVPVSNGTASYAAKHQIADHFIGGNRLANAPPSVVKDFVAEHDGHTVITNVSIALPRRPRATPGLTPPPTGSDRQQRYCRRQGDPISTEMGLRDVWRRKGHSVHSHGHA